MINIRIGGVPEHFNLPWHDVIADARDYASTWRDYPGGSGAMIDALASDELDVAILLTEAAVAGAEKSGGLRIVGRYTDSPLLWGIHVPGGSAAARTADLKNARFAISRFGSGSHLMACVLADQRGWPAGELELVEVDSLDGAVAAFAEGRADVFLWERFMTQPVVDSGAFRRIGEFSAPWPGFVVCAADTAWRRHRAIIEDLVDRALARARALISAPDAAARFAERYALGEPLVEEWLAVTRWAPRREIVAAELDAARAALDRAGLLR
jgi:ABC-type nitrate/sulfonate/bicarbonate transport system substrate-binding protein